MPFTLQQDPTYSWTVPLVIPTDDGQAKDSFVAEFRRLSQTRINEIVRIYKESERSRSYDEGDEFVDQDLARELLAGWRDVINVVDGKKEQIPFSDAALTKLLELPTVAAQIIRAWFESIDISKKKR